MSRNSRHERGVAIRLEVGAGCNVAAEGGATAP